MVHYTPLSTGSASAYQKGLSQTRQPIRMATNFGHTRVADSPQSTPDERVFISDSPRFATTLLVPKLRGSRMTVDFNVGRLRDLIEARLLADTQILT